MWDSIAEAVRAELRRFADVGSEHPVFAARPYKVFLRTPDEICGRIDYVDDNPTKEGLPSQHFDFVQSYNNWPHHKVAPMKG